MPIRSIHIHIEQSKMVLECVLCELATHWNTCILDYYVELSALLLQFLEDLVCYCFYLIVAGHIQLNNLNFLRMRTVLLYSFKFSCIASWNDELGSASIVLIRHIFSQTRWSSSNPNCFAIIVRFGNFSSHIGKKSVSKE